MDKPVNRQWLMKSRPVGMIKRENFEWVESPIQEVSDGQILLRNLYLSFDPTQRSWMAGPTYLPAIKPSEVMRAIGVGQVIRSNNPSFEPGQFVSGFLGWQDYCLIEREQVSGFTKVPSGVPIPMYMSVLGITGLTAYFGLLDVGKLQSGETVVVSGAAGATGSVVAQLAKIKGAKVIGIAGGSEKCRWLLDEIGIDGVIDYKSERLEKRLRALAPEGVNLYFDNVGGETLDIMLTHIVMRGRIVLCGAISEYNSVEPEHGLKNYPRLIINRARMEGFLILDYLDQFEKATEELVEWIDQGKIKYQVDIMEGLEVAPETLNRLFTGKNRGKQLLRIADAPLGGEALA